MLFTRLALYDAIQQQRVRVRSWASDFHPKEQLSNRNALYGNVAEHFGRESIDMPSVCRFGWFTVFFYFPLIRPFCVFGNIAHGDKEKRSQFETVLIRIWREIIEIHLDACSTPIPIHTNGYFAEIKI